MKFAACLLSAAFIVSLPFLVSASEKPVQTPTEKMAVDDSLDLLPPPASTTQTIRVHGRVLKYTVTAGASPIYDENGRLIAQVAFTYYGVTDRNRANRPVTFVFNGGPGASAAILNLGALGPKRLAIGAPGDSAAKQIELKDNPETWLDLTDLVFVDPIGTGYSRHFLNEEDSMSAFFNTESDINYLSQFIANWLLDYDRIASPKYLAGESYGGFRVPRLIRRLQLFHGIGVRGGVIISPFLDSGAEYSPDFSPVPWTITLPGMAAANLERQDKLNTESMQPVIDYARDEYLRDLVIRRSDPDATDRMIANVTRFTGLSETFVQKFGARIPVRAFLREFHRDQGKIGDSTDPNFTQADPSPYALASTAGSPMLDNINGPLTAAMVEILTNQVGWRVNDAPFYLVNLGIYERFVWEGPQGKKVDSNDIRRILAADPELRLMFAHGWSDLSTPFMGTLLLLDQMPPTLKRDRVELNIYKGGHMFFFRKNSLLGFRKDAEKFYEQSRP